MFAHVVQTSSSHTIVARQVGAQSRREVRATSTETDGSARAPAREHGDRVSIEVAVPRPARAECGAGARVERLARGRLARRVAREHAQVEAVCDDGDGGAEPSTGRLPRGRTRRAGCSAGAWCGVAAGLAAYGLRAHRWRSAQRGAWRCRASHVQEREAALLCGAARGGAQAAARRHTDRSHSERRGGGVEASTCRRADCGPGADNRSPAGELARKPKR